MHVGDERPRASDGQVWDSAIRSHRIRITNDVDFGLLHQRRTLRPDCVILVRPDALRPVARLDRTLAAIQALGETGLSGFVVIEPGLIRRSRD
jgi:predicted nuclease of predicted toxin-antitoxin system